ncbi:hypothetical protein LPJ66_000914 [Kickxella alabastrina]|uniref:Uncharacterized protein n=1 Tax=Kickxella alabastrina TaxID=61397 RepID=A0ACC1IV23_9FUNG|nr:hypothetical protein LPJ66_000914 [Kickxella alabastrina]
MKFATIASIVCLAASMAHAGPVQGNQDQVQAAASFDRVAIDNTAQFTKGLLDRIIVNLGNLVSNLLEDTGDLVRSVAGAPRR